MGATGRHKRLNGHKANAKRAHRHHSEVKAPTNTEPSNHDVTETSGRSNSPRSAGKTVIIKEAMFSMKAFNAERDLPIVYSDKYNIYMAGLELLHHFDTKKYSKMANLLNDEFMDTNYARLRHYDEPHREGDEDHIRPRRLRYLSPNRPISLEELEIHHHGAYVARIHENKSLIARITEIWLLNLVPMCAIEARLLLPLRWQVAGTIYATLLAMQHGWAINLGGGFHQSSASDGRTFCLFSDVCLAMKYVWRRHPLQKFMIIDLDAHQATGLERDIIELEPKRRKMVFVLDVFNVTIQPPDLAADRGIDLRVELGRFTGDETYLLKIEEALEAAFSKFKPTVIIYIAGQDVLRDDQLGLMSLSDEALFRRDERVFSWATERQKCPILMLLGGGYLARGTKVQAESIRNLFAKGLIWGGHRSGSRSLSRPLRAMRTEAPRIAPRQTTDIASNIVANSEPVKAKVIPTAPVSKRFVEKRAADVSAAKQASDVSGTKKTR